MEISLAGDKPAWSEYLKARWATIPVGTAKVYNGTQAERRYQATALDQGSHTRL